MADPIANVVVSMPSQLFTRAAIFQACENGSIYIGLPDTDPQLPQNQIQVYIAEEDGNLLPVDQPIKINAGGYPVDASGQIQRFVTEQNFSMTVTNASGGVEHTYSDLLKYSPDQLRADLANPAPGYGVDLVAGAAKAANIPYIPLTAVDGFDYADIIPAWQKSKADYGYVFLPNYSTNEVVYNIADLISNKLIVSNTKVIVDPNVVLSFNTDLYEAIKTINFVGKCKFRFVDKNFRTTGGDVKYIADQAILNRSPKRLKRIPFTDCRARSLNGDVFSSAAIGTSSETAAIIPITASQYTGLFVPIDIGEQISGHARMESGSASEIGLMLRCSNGWILFYGAPGAGQWNYKQKAIGGAIVDGAPFPIPGGMLSYSPGNAAMGIALKSKNMALLTVNGVGIRVPFDTSAIGDVYEVGFVAFSTSSTASVRVTGVNLYTSRYGINGFPPLNILIHGDSTSEGFISAFDKYIPQLMDGVNGGRSYKIVNKSVAGQTMRQQLDLLKAQGPGDAYIVMMVAGTNEGQGNASGDTIAALIDEFVLYCNSIGRVALWVEPWMWYSNTFIGGSGQASNNYQNVAELREAGKRQMTKYADSAVICVSTTHQLPAPLPEYFGTQYDPLLRDDIHQSQLGYRLYAELICSSIIDWWTRIDYSSRVVAPWMLSSPVVTAVGDSAMTTNSIKGTFTVVGFANGGTVVSLPRWCRPDRQISVPAVFTTTGGAYAACRAKYDPATTNITVDGLTQTGSNIVIDMNW